MEKPQITNVIVLQTVLEEVKHLSPSIHKRVRDMISNKEKRFYAFSNEHHRETFIEKLKDESPNDRNDRAIRAATRWYGKHIQHLKPKVGVVMMTDDVANREKATADGLQAVSGDFTWIPYYRSFCVKECHGTDLENVAIILAHLQSDGTSRH